MEILVAILVVVGIFALIIPLYILNGAVLIKLWEWFIVPFGLPEIGLAHAIGVAMIISYLTQSTDTREKTGKEQSQVLIIALLRPLLALLVGYIVKSFM